MTFEDIYDHCRSKLGTEETFPFGEDTLVFKVAGKIFALISLDSIPLTMNLKCDPEKALELRDRYETVQPGYHMNKKHWNTIEIPGGISSDELREWIDDSYDLVVQSLKRTDREALMGG